ncbi:(E)-4-hydroxy-3-methylbut-2-enyl-diphosphate synthase [Candidatus Fermentibacteria bacterium]|nr:(E)-4-hydroxy-3-methylbut-2-enyl-diphosphate synthase [Candidatus Fermentibacteria bacterium]
MRRVTRPVTVGKVTIGGGALPVVQSMTSTPTTDIGATAEQVLRLHGAGSRLVRIALPNRRALKALPALRSRLSSHHEPVPLVGDIHFSLAMALEALPLVDKIRVNPGNLLEPPLSRAVGAFPAPDDLEPLRSLFRAARSAGRAVRVGVNHGSLSRRIVEGFGRGVDAMVQSAVEYVHIAEKEGFLDLVISLKSSDPWDVVRANLGIASCCDYPLHVGVTEAGFGLQGRTRSAVGIGLLLRHGIADTIRVSLAEPPERELPVAYALVNAARLFLIPGAPRGGTPRGVTPVEGVQVVSLREHAWPFTRIRFDGEDGHVYDPVSGRRVRVVSHSDPDRLPGEPAILRVTAAPPSPGDLATILAAVLDSAQTRDIIELQLPLPGPTAGGADRLTEVLARIAQPITWEVVTPLASDLLRAMVDLAQLVEAGLIQRLELHHGIDEADDRASALDILQGLGTGQWCAHIIACPQCGRCRIDVAELATEVRRRLGARAGLTVGVMGCIVNGPGEMRGADIGCVGEGQGKVALYAGGRLVAHGVPVEEATLRLEALADALESERAAGHH